MVGANGKYHGGVVRAPALSLRRMVAVADACMVKKMESDCWEMPSGLPLPYQTTWPTRYLFHYT